MTKHGSQIRFTEEVEEERLKDVMRIWVDLKARDSKGLEQLDTRYGML